VAKTALIPGSKTAIPAGLFVLAAGIVAAAWWWLGAPVQMPASPLGAREKLHCVSYAPFRGEQNPLEAGTLIPPAQIEEDLALLSTVTNCVRTYSIEHGLDRIPEIAQRLGLKVLHGIWLSSHPDKNQQQIATTIALAKKYPDVIQAVIVGNEVLLRGEMSATDLANTIREVKSQISMPVTYADVWEFWLRHRDLAGVVDFITIHILPYWEDFPIPADNAAAHVASIRGKVMAAFPGKEIFLGEVGWPSAGRMREGALPSRANQAHVIHDVLALSKRHNFRVNVIEAFDQPWKRRLEGAVGGHWGLIDDATRMFKFRWGEAVSNHPMWGRNAILGVMLAAIVFAAAWTARRSERAPAAPTMWISVALIAATAGFLVGWAAESAAIESFNIGGWIRSLALLAVAIALPVAAAAAHAAGHGLPAMTEVVGPPKERIRDALSLALGFLLIALCVLAIQAALGLVFDPRYRDFPFAPVTAATVPLLLVSLLRPKAVGVRPLAEIAAAAVLGASAIYIAFNEGVANWQAIWFCAAIVGLAVTLLRARVARG
jgi:exo-beta-1,3-glucanase (GH17 family)